MNKKLKKKQALIMAEPYRTPFNSKVAKVSGDVIEDSVGGIKYATSFDGATKIVDGNKNLLPLPDIEETTQNGVTYSIKGGIITLNGTTTGTFNLRLENVVKVEENQTYYFYQKTENTVTTFNLVSDIYNYSAEPTFFQYNNKSKKMTKTGYLTLHLYITNTTTFTNAKFYVMLVLGTTAPTTFEPNFKNLFYVENVADTTINGLTFSINNGVLTINGTSTDNVLYTFGSGDENILTFNKSNYSLKIYSSNATNSSYYIGLGNHYYDFYYEGSTGRTLTNNDRVVTNAITVRIDGIGIVFNNAKFMPMLVLGAIVPSQFIPFANPYFVSLGQNGSVQYNGLEPREIDLKGNVISKINNQASDKLSNYSLTKNTKVVDLGSLDWSEGVTQTSGIIRWASNQLASDIVHPNATNIAPNLLCTRYDTITADQTFTKVKGITLDQFGNLVIYDPDYNTSDKLEAFKKAIRGTLLMYQTKNPTTINTTSFKTFKEDTNATISDDNFTSSPNAITETFKPTRSYDFKVNGFSNVVKSNNLLNILDKANTTTNGITYSVKNGVITLNGTNSSTSTQWIWIDFVSTLNGIYSFNSFAPTTTYVVGTRISLYDNTTEKPIAQLFNNEYSSTIELTNYECKKIGIACGAGQTFTNATIKPMLVSGSTIPSTFEPYFDPYIESFADKKNLLNLPIKSGTINNVSYNISQGNVLTLNGTMSTVSNYIMVNDLNLVLEKGIYTFAISKPMLINNVVCTLILGTTDGDLIFAIRGDNTSITTILPSKTTINYLRMWINPTTFNNYQISLMLIHGKIAPTTFLPYQDKYSAFLSVKGKNLLEFDDVENATANNGMTYSIKDGVITANGTPTETGKGLTLYFNPIGINVGDTYSIALFNQFTSPIGFFVQDKSNTGNANINLGKDKNIAKTWTVKAGSLYNAIVMCFDANKTYTNEVIKPILVSGSTIPTEFEPYYSFTKEVLIKQPLRKFDYLTYDGVYRQTNEIVLDGTNNIYVDESSGIIQVINIPNVDSLNTDWGINYASQLMVTTSNLPLIQSYLIQVEKQKGIGTNNGRIFIKLDDSADNSLNNWTVEKVNNYFKQNPITITYKTVDQTFEATSLTRLLFKNGYNKITAFDSINNNAIVEYLEYYKSK